MSGSFIADAPSVWLTPEGAPLLPPTPEPAPAPEVEEPDTVYPAWYEAEDFAMYVGAGI